MADRRKTVAVDLDGVLADFSMGWTPDGVFHIGDPIPGAVAFTRRLSEFADVLIWTTRTNPEVGRGTGASLLRNIVREWLDRHGFAYADIWTGPGKPIAAAFIDDRAVPCRPGTVGAVNLGTFNAALIYAQALVKTMPPGCSGSHTMPVLEESRNTTHREGGTPEVCRGLDREDGPPETAKVADGTPPVCIAPSSRQSGLEDGGSNVIDDRAWLAGHVAELLDVATRNGSLLYADRLPAELSNALAQWRLASAANSPEIPVGSAEATSTPAEEPTR